MTHTKAKTRKSRRQWLPTWAQPDHPIVAREMANLPRFLGDDGRITSKAIVLTLLGMGLASCSCTCGGFPWALLMIPLNLLPMIWGSMIINRDRATQMWDMLRITPYSPREIVLAKLSAATYRLAPLLALLLAGQIMSYLIASSFPLFLGYGSWISFSVNGSSAQSPWLNPDTAMVLGVVGMLFVYTIVNTGVIFFTNLLLGALASSLTTGRSAAIIEALAMRIGLSLLFAVTNLLLAMLLMRGDSSATIISGLSIIGQSVSWLMWNAPYDTSRVVLLSGLMVILQAGALAGLFRLTIWRASA